MPATFHFQKVANLTEQNNTMKIEKNNFSSREIWKSAINTLLTALENILLDDNGMPIKQGGADVEDRYVKGPSSDTMMEESESSFGSLSPLKRKREDSSLRKTKSQKLLSSKLARGLSLSEDESNDESIPPKADALMEICGANPTSSNPSRPLQRNVRRRQLFGGRCARPTAALPSDNANIFDMDITPDHHTADGDIIKVHELERIQMFHRIISEPSDSYLSWSVTMSDWIELQAQKKNMSSHEFQVQFQERIRDVESSLTVLNNSLPQVYDEIQVLVDKFLLNANWLRCDYCKSFTQIFPQWQSLGKKMESIVRFVAVVEDMKAIVNCDYPHSGDLSFDMKKIREILESKKSLYGEILQQNGLVWKALGYPVSDAWIHETKHWLFNLSSHCLSFMNNELNKDKHFDDDDARTTKLMENVMNCIKITSISVELIGTSSDKLILPSLSLATAYTEWELLQIDRMEKKVRCVEVRMMHICDNIDKILHYLHIIQDANEQDTIIMRENDRGVVTPPGYQQNLNIIENFSTAFVEAGLRLCEHVVKLKADAVTSPSNSAYMCFEFVVKFINRALEYTGLEDEAEVRMRPLLASLKNMENAAKIG